MLRKIDFILLKTQVSFIKLGIETSSCGYIVLFCIEIILFKLAYVVHTATWVFTILIN